MINLSEFTGLDIQLDERLLRLEFGNGLNKVDPDGRTLTQMKEVLLDKNITHPEELYYMYRGISKNKDRQLINENKLRFDITIIRPGKLGREFMKTAGHYHQGLFPELYDVVFGSAFCLLQKVSQDPKIIEDVILVSAKQGEKIVCIPGYGHILLNPADTPLVTANWVSTQFTSQYDAYKNAGGAAYYIIEENKKMKISGNAFFKNLAPIRNVHPKGNIERFGLSCGEPLYPIINKDAKKLDFLNNPEAYDYSDVFVPIV